MNRCLSRLGALPKKLVWDREGAIHAGGGRPTEPSPPSAASSPRLDHPRSRATPEAKGALERSHRFLHGNFEAGRRFANPLDFQQQLDGWCDKVNDRVAPHHRARSSASASPRSASGCGPLPEQMPDIERRFVMRVPPQPYLRVDRNDYSLDPRLAGRRVEVRVTQAEVSAVALDTGEVAAHHNRAFAGGLTFTDPAHQRRLRSCAASAPAGVQSPRSRSAPLPATTS